jgi:hypothetical protein
MKERPHQTKFIERVLDKFSEIGSFKSTDYQKFTVCSSYTLTLIEAYMLSKRVCKVSQRPILANMAIVVKNDDESSILLRNRHKFGKRTAFGNSKMVLK